MHGERFARRLPERNPLETPHPDRNAGLEQLEQQLATLLSAMREGNWEEVVLLEPQLTSLMGAIGRDSAGLRAEQLEVIRRVVSLLDTAVVRSGERMQQISPLLEALSTSHEPPTKP